MNPEIKNRLKKNLEIYKLTLKELREGKSYLQLTHPDCVNEIKIYNKQEESKRLRESVKRIKQMLAPENPYQDELKRLRDLRK